MEKPRGGGGVDLSLKGLCIIHFSIAVFAQTAGRVQQVQRGMGETAEAAERDREREEEKGKRPGRQGQGQEEEEEPGMQ